MSASINFFYAEKSSKKLSDKKRTKDWIRQILKNEKRSVSVLNYIFCSDTFLLAINRQYLRHNTLTDIITFDLSEGNDIEGEIYISLDRVRANAKEFKRPYSEELRRVIAHGVLHLLGYNDKKASEKTEMRRKEEACLSLY